MCRQCGTFLFLWAKERFWVSWVLMELVKPRPFRCCSEFYYRHRGRFFILVNLSPVTVRKFWSTLIFLRHIRIFLGISRYVKISLSSLISMILMTDVSDWRMW